MRCVAMMSAAATLVLLAGCGGNGPGLGIGECRESSDCNEAMGEGCVRADDPPACGACFTSMNPCNVDADCSGLGAGMICEPVVCACDFTDLECTPGCTGDENCREGTTCGAGSRCVPSACVTRDDCPVHFDCGTAATCERRACTRDGECDAGGTCVRGNCFDSPGMCMGPVP